jgi:hypothetical protein
MRAEYGMYYNAIYSIIIKKDILLNAVIAYSEVYFRALAVDRTLEPIHA